MGVKVKVNINTAKIMQQRGLGASNNVRKFLASEVKKLSDPYVPMNTGTLKNGAVVAEDGSTLTYQGPYAHYQYHGKVMGPNVETKDGWRSMAGKGGKKYTGEDLTYSGGPMRGDHWVERMIADKKKDLEKSVEAHIKNKK